MIKRTLSLSGHQTSLALEPEFWEALTVLAEHKQQSWSQLVGDIDANRVSGNLASAVRVAILADLMARVTKEPPN